MLKRRGVLSGVAGFSIVAASVGGVKRFQPVSTNSTHSVSSRSVMQGTR